MLSYHLRLSKLQMATLKLPARRRGQGLEEQGRQGEHGEQECNPKSKITPRPSQAVDTNKKLSDNEKLRL